MTIEQRSNFKFLVRSGKSPSEALCMLQQVYQEQTLFCSTVLLWHKRFKEGRENVEGNPRDVRLSTSRNEIFFDIRGKVHYEFLTECQTFNQHVYKEILQRLLCSVREKRRDLWESNILLLYHDNAPAHTALSIRKFLADKNITVPKQSPYLSAFAPCSFFLFLKVEISLKKHIFQAQMQ